MRCFVLGIFIFLSMIGTSWLQAWDDTPECFKRIEDEIFNPRSVNPVFSKHLYYMNQSSWNILNRMLTDRVHNLHQQLHEVGNRLVRNPFDHPFQPKAAVKILYDTLFIEFDQVMRDNNVKSSDVIATMFQEIWGKQAFRLNTCLKLDQVESK